MQDEVTKHTRKIYRAAKNSKHSFGEKLKEIIIEILIIVFAVTLSIWFHSWSEHRHEQQEVREFLKGLKDDLTEDIKMLETNRNVTARLDSNFIFLFSYKNNQLSDAVADSIISKRFYFDFRVTRPNIGRYEGFKSSGKIGTIENDSLKQDILFFHQQTIPDIQFGEEFVNTFQSKLLDMQVERNYDIPVKDFIQSTKLKSLLSIGMQNFENNIDGYTRAIKLAQKIIAEINKELE